MKKDVIKVSNARVHNLKNISVEIPKHKLTVITGLSGSGKSSLAFDTIYAEGQRRYAESLNAYARQFMDLQDKPDVDDIQGLSPTIAIDQKTVSKNPRSTVGTVTEIYDYLRLLFSRIGVQYDPETNEPLRQFSTGEITETVRNAARESSELVILSPIIKHEKVKAKQLLTVLEKSGYSNVRINGAFMPLTHVKKFSFDPKKSYEVDLVIARIVEPKVQDIQSFVETALDLSNGYVTVLDEDTAEEEMYSLQAFSEATGKEFQPIEPRSFSFNSPYGACTRCSGLGYTLDVDPTLVVPNPKLTLAEGAIQPWTRIVGNQAQYQELLRAVSEVQGFSMDTPVQELSKKVMDIVMYGTDDKEYVVGKKKTIFTGVVPNLIQRHAETKSDYVRKEIEQYMHERTCPVCEGKRLKRESLFVRIGELSIGDVVEMSVEDALPFFDLKKKTGTLLNHTQKKDHVIAKPIIKEIASRIENLNNVGLGYMTLDRSVATLSGGEGQRIRLSTQLSTGLSDLIYILDEPSIGLHSRDNSKLIDTLKVLRDAGNTVIVVEHDDAMIKEADHVIDIGPGAGTLGGEVIGEGTPESLKTQSASVTGEFLSGKECIEPPKKYRKGSGKSIDILGATAFNLKNVDVSIPLGKLVCVTGVSGSGKSSLIINILGRALSKKFYRAKAEPGTHKKIKGINHIDKVISIDQTPIGRTPRSNPATYTGVFTAIRDVFANTQEARMRNMDAGKFSFNVKGGGRCEACAGQGYICIPMQFLSDVFVECPECNGKRYNREALEVNYRGKTIAEVLDMTIDEAYNFFNDTPAIADKLRILRDVGLGYLHLGQSATTLSGGEAQRIKLATELSRRSTGDTLYILDEPTTGLHFADIKRLLEVLNKLVDKGNTVLIIEHNLDVINASDWIIDLGPDGGKKGGEIVAAGTPKEVMKVTKSYTGKYLKELNKK